MDLDELLAAASPPVTVRTPRLERDLADLVVASEAAALPRGRWAVRVALVGAALAGAIGVGAVASAAGVLPGWPSFDTASGDTCEVALSASALRTGDGEPPLGSSISDAERERTLTEARSFLATFDYDSVDREQAIDWWRTEEARAHAAQPEPAERAPRLAGDDLEVTAVSLWVVDHLRSDLAAKGLDIRAISVTTTSSGCDL